MGRASSKCWRSSFFSVIYESSPKLCVISFSVAIIIPKISIVNLVLC